MVPATHEILLLAVAYLGFFVGLYLVLDGLYSLAATDRASATAEVDDDHETVVCPTCGSENGGGYLYCRDCTTQLATTASDPTRTSR